ncbi:nef attachable domain protein [Chlamydia psittaci 02DC14]|nr:nef attachable domain protein [Chlamydia psittaci 02DC21]EPL02389.1 nef attachable domain protein [Chlamydia psittaci 02DC14]EPP30859.1 nef attachable domain protein [Chlamydia psittaci C1/97]
MCSLNSSHRVKTFPSRTPSLRLFLWNLKSDIWKRLQGYGEKGNYLR